MPTIKKIKRTELGELGEEFTVLTDAEMADSGLTVADDEVIVVATPAPVQPPASDDNSPELLTLRSRLHTVNQESASRRLTNKQLAAQLDAANATIEDLQKKETLREQEGRKTSAKTLFSEIAKEKKYVFVDENAESDIRDTALASIDWTKEVTKETLVPLVDQTVEKRKYALKKAELPPTGGGRQGSMPEGTVEIDLAEVAQSFHIPYKPEKQSKEQ